MELRPVIATLLKRTLWHLALFAGYGTFYVPLAEGSCAFHFAVLASGGSGVTLQQYDATFSQYLNEQLSVELNCTFNITPIYRVGQYYEQFAQGSVDFALLDATTFACLNVSCRTCSFLPQNFQLALSLVHTLLGVVHRANLECCLLRPLHGLSMAQKLMQQEQCLLHVPLTPASSPLNSCVVVE